jgi:hypothetical protein
MSLKPSASSCPAFLFPEDMPINFQTANRTREFVAADPNILTALNDFLGHDEFCVTGISICHGTLQQVKTIELAAVFPNTG